MLKGWNCAPNLLQEKYPVWTWIEDSYVPDKKHSFRNFSHFDCKIYPKSEKEIKFLQM